jgi:hypothetical protein
LAGHGSSAGLRDSGNRTDAVQNRFASLGSALVWNRRIGSVSLVASGVAVAFALVALSTDSKETRTYLSIAVAIAVAISFAWALLYVSRLEARSVELSTWSRSWRYLAIGSVVLTAGATMALTLSAEGQLNVGYTIHSTDTLATINSVTTVNHAVTLNKTIRQTVTINHTTSRTVRLSRTVYVTNMLPPTR